MHKGCEYWGCPNWREPEKYGDWETWLENRWRWEFKRRSRAVRTTFQLRLFKQWRQDNPGVGIPQDLMWKAEHARTLFTLNAPDAARLGVWPLPNPLYSDAMEWADEEYRWSGKTVNSRSLEARTLTSFDVYHRSQTPIGRVDILGPMQIAIVFDPSSSIEPQLDGLKEHLESYQHHSNQTLIRKQRDKWLRYLRILDAREDGATWAECARALLQGSTAATPQTARDTYAQAVKTRDGL